MLILHHKYTSPFSEKIRLMLGYTGIPWVSMITPLTPPRPIIDSLLDGYRKIPVAQIGADVFCDTKIICDEISNFTNNPALSPFGKEPDVTEFLNYLDDTCFHACVISAPVLGILWSLGKKVPFLQWKSFLQDKKHISETATLEHRPTRAQARVIWQQHLELLDEKLSDRLFFYGKNPHIVDFNAVHTIWFREDMQGRAIFKGLNNLESWYQRMLAFGRKNVTEITHEEFTNAVSKAPRPIPESMITNMSIGKTVSIAPTDTMQIPTVGTLVGENDDRWIISRETQHYGRIHAHFPKVNFNLTVV